MSYMTNFSKGLRVYGVPVNPMIGSEMNYGNVYWVDSTHAYAADTTANGAKSKPFATIDYAIGQCTASNGDVIYVGPHHAETVTAAITMDVAGVRIRGIKLGALRPIITPNGAIDALTMTAAGCSIAGVKFAAPVTDAQTADINIAARYCSVFDTIHIGSDTALNKVDIITITADGDDCLLDGLMIYNTVVECPSGIKLEGAFTNGEIRNCFVWDEIGFTNGAIYDAAIATGLYIHHNVFSNAKADTVVVNFVTNSTGVCSFNHVNGRHSTLASNVVAGTGMNFFENRVVEQAALNGAIIPAADTE